MAIDFPDSPSVGQTYEAQGRKWKCTVAGPPAIWKLQPGESTPGIALSGRVADYASLPSVGVSAGDAYLVDSDKLIYVYDGTSFPDEGDGLSSSGEVPKIFTPDCSDNMLRERGFVYSSRSRQTGSNRTNTYQRILDGSTSTNPYLDIPSVGGTPEWVMVALPFPIYLNGITVWHYWSDGRTYHGTKTEISMDGVNWTTIFDSATEGEYAESSTGRVTTFAPQYVRFIRDYLNGNTVNTGNHWIQISASYVP